jgi:hypothetical protein
VNTTKLPDIIDGILPRHRVHLIAGPVGIGKTTMEMQMIEAVRDHKSFFGYATEPVPILYISADRTVEEHLETCERIGVPMDGIRMVTVEDYKSLPLLTEILSEHAKEGYLVIVEPLPFFLVNHLNQPGNINDPLQVARWLTVIRKKCRVGKYTLLGSCHGAKVKEGSNYAIMREKIAGCSSWGAYTSTILYIEPADPSNPASRFRNVHFMFRNRANVSVQFQLNATNGRFEVCEEGKSDAWLQLDKELFEWPNGSFSNQDIETWAEMCSCSRATAYRWVKSRLDKGLVTRLSRTNYLKISAFDPN